MGQGLSSLHSLLVTDIMGDFLGSVKLYLSNKPVREHYRKVKAGASWKAYVTSEPFFPVFFLPKTSVTYKCVYMHTHTHTELASTIKNCCKHFCNASPNFFIYLFLALSRKL